MHPYKGLPEESFWRSGVADHVWPDINFMPRTKFNLTPEDRIATAGSCFAQHIAKNLSALGLTYLVQETAPSLLSKERSEALQYGVYSARYGNIYTARQLRQLIEFAFDERPETSLFHQGENGWFDLLRPGVQSEGFFTLHDLACDREFHLARVKALFLEATCFVFTLGLTEAWYDVQSGNVFSVCPGTKVGEYRPDEHKFVNFRFAEIVEDLRWCIEFVGKLNPGMKWIFTVSPVALAATATANHVLIANTASKSILRAVADEICRDFDHCEYFPSYEICSSVANFGQFLDADLRSISPRGVKVVMRTFKRAFCGPDARTGAEDAPNNISAVSSLREQIRAAAKTECDEVFNVPPAN